ncbi:MAG: hypothetical protein APF82_10240 [Sphingomonadales bacterium BRH_c42]|nr:MAG: hypothetical protein APF82_10240 [Sphingomonadales bacterium BRH_c42]
MIPLWGLVAAALLLALTGCKQDHSAADAETPAPLLWEIRDNAGAVRGWLFGTIHALPDGARWRTQRLEQAIDQADLLVVEIAALNDRDGMAQVFTRLATSPGLPDIGMRVPAGSRPELFGLIESVDLTAADFSEVETWAAALVLAQAGDNGDAANGADLALLRDFANRKVHEFEGAQRQLGIFDGLPEAEQRDLLLAVMKEVRANEADPERLRRAWLKGDARTLETAASTGLMEDPELREALLVARNRAWIGQLEAILASGERPLIAVGTAHLLGPDGLPALLEHRGYSVARIQ